MHLTFFSLSLGKASMHWSRAAIISAGSCSFAYYQQYIKKQIKQHSKKVPDVYWVDYYTVYNIIYIVINNIIYYITHLDNIIWLLLDYL